MRTKDMLAFRIEIVHKVQSELSGAITEFFRPFWILILCELGVHQLRDLNGE